MPATEQTWRDSKLLHLVFGISSLAMLITTIWMLAADHRREWKDYQRKFQKIETWTATARIDQLESAQYNQEKKAAEDAWQAARHEVPDRGEIDRFEQTVKQHQPGANFEAIDGSYRALAQVPAGEKPAKREDLLDAMARYVKDARFEEDKSASEKKFRAADFDVARSEFELAVGNAASKQALDALQEKVTTVQGQVADAIDRLQESTTYRKALESIVTTITADEVAARKQLDDLTGQLAQLEKARYERENSAMKEFTELPILDAFGRPIKIDQIWLPKLTINNNFSDVARFDRCTTCHQAIDKTAPGSAIAPGYESQHTLTLTMQTPAEAPEQLKKSPADVPKEKLYGQLLEEVYGLQLAKEGLLDADDATVSVIRPETPGAKAELNVGDVIDSINDVRIFGRDKALGYLLESVAWGQPLKLTVRRGLPNPFASHPRLDLFVGSLSPHKMADVGCTICHEGQGSATSFKWASHSPNDVFEADRWKRELGWFDNHHWIFPMVPNRFAESTCLKCHHEVTDLEPSERFPEPPAPKVVEGFRLIQQVGCFGCHEINGWDGPNRRIGPDLRTEPNYAAAAEAILAGGGLSDQQQGWARDVAQQPANDAARHSLVESLKSSEKLPGSADATKKLLAVLDDVETPGKLRKVGPSLRHVASKLDFNFLYSWIRKPSDFRPSTKMPQFFGLTDHLDEKSLEVSHQFEPIEIRGLIEYLLAKSQPFEYTPPPKSVTVEASPERGKLAFEVRCVACHKHEDFPAATMTQGPDLSRLGAKLARKDNPNGPKWLYTWLRNPSKYHARTLMPNLILDPVPGADGKLTDPAADIAAFLLGSKEGWEVKDVPAHDLSDSEQKALFDLALDHLKNVFPKRQAESYLKTGIPESRSAEIKGDEVELIGEMSPEKQLQYVGRRTISKYGCSGCHDVPGFEDAKPIGTGLADWARKTADKLAFEQIVEYLQNLHGKPGRWEPVPSAERDVTDKQIQESEATKHGHKEFIFTDMPPAVGYFMEKLVGHQREGFIWQKLREPRSYDYEKAQNKGYNERLRMPKFTVLDDAQREAIITFVMGLVAEPPAPQYVYHPTPRRDAIVQGLQVIEKFNCTGCHTLNMERWELAYEPGDFPDPPTIGDFPFLQAHFNPQQIKDSLKTDDRGLRHTTLTGIPAVDEEGKPLRLDEDGAPVEADDTTTKAFYPFVLWDNALINGQARQAGLQNILVPESRVEKRQPFFGGFLSRFAYPLVVAEEKKVNQNVKADEAWGWLPPPLVGEGRKVQTEWLHSFLLDPYPIRPAAVLRMPKFNMSSGDASKLANYFAAVDGADYPYDFDPRTTESHLVAADAEHPHRLSDALKIVTDNNFCIKCHLLGDFDPTGSERAKGPRLDLAFKRLRPEFTLRWIANPKRILPYTGMPVNIPYDKPVSEALYKGTSDQQLNAVVDLLLNYDRYTDSKTPIKQMIKPLTVPAADNRPPTAQSQAAAQ